MSGVTGQHMVPRGAADPLGHHRAGADPALSPGPRAAPGDGVDTLVPESTVGHTLLLPILVLQPGQHSVTGGAWGMGTPLRGQRPPQGQHFCI